MILGTASGFPVIAAVATADRHYHVVECPHCGENHSHGGYGPRAPFGAINGARFAHCRNFDENRLCVLVEVPGKAAIRLPGPDEGDYFIREVRYAPHADELSQRNTEVTIRAYEALWVGLYERRCGAPGRAELVYREEFGGFLWPAGFDLPERPTLYSKRCAVYLHFDADGVLLYVGVSDNVVRRGKDHARHSVWVPFAVRGEHVWCDDRAAALRTEAELIRTLRPLFNDVHADPGSAARRAAYLAGKGVAMPAVATSVRSS